MKITKNGLAGAFAQTTAILWVLCTVFVALWPGFSLKVTKWWLHGMNIDALGKFHLGWGNFIWGGLTLILSAWVVGYVLGWSLEVAEKAGKKGVNR